VSNELRSQKFFSLRQQGTSSPFMFGFALSERKTEHEKYMPYLPAEGQTSFSGLIALDKETPQ
jgi:hypothetical protein